MKHNIIKVAVASPSLQVADPAYNAKELVRTTWAAATSGAKILVTPELGLTGYTCGDLFLQQPLLEAAMNALEGICTETAELDILLIVGVPLVHRGKLYNCAAVISAGRVLGLVPKTNIPNYSEFYELRHFSPAFTGIQVFETGFLQGVPMGADLLFRCEELQSLIVAAEICEDLWVPAPPSIRHAAAGATVIANLSASDETVGKAAYRRSLVTGQSARLLCAYLYADAGSGESSTDMVFAGHDLICENGVLLAESESFGESITFADVDLERLTHDRRRMNTFAQQEDEHMLIPFSLEVSDTPLSRFISPSPFVPQDEATLTERCEAILAIQAQGLARRLRHTGASSAVVGVSGGLDSTLALLVTARAFELLGRSSKEIFAVTMPCFGTTRRTRTNAEKLAEALGTTLLTIDITDTVRSHFDEIGHSEEDHSVVYENAQARVRTLVLMDLANTHGGLVVGTGDMSEVALGWATYNGDHMSMYGVNASIPKTLIRDLIGYVAKREEALRDTLQDILDTPVSPELLPPTGDEISQITEDLVGPYLLHDFFLYYFLRWGFGPGKILRLAEQAFKGEYDRATILQWLAVFTHRFFTQQFKRSCLPDGPKVGSVTLSPRGDWRMPSDASAAVWKAELQKLTEEG